MPQSIFSVLFLALRQLLRETKAGEVRVLFFALLIAVAVSSAIGHFAERLQGAMQSRAGEFLAADLVLSGTVPATAAQIQTGVAHQLRHASTVEFATMLASEEALQLVSVKAASNHYPLRGELASSTEVYGNEVKGDAPQAGEIWLEPRLFAALKISVGDLVDLGAIQLKATRALTYEPDRGASFANLTPRGIMHLDDLAASQVVQPGSRVRYRELWAGDETNLTAYKQAIALTAQQQFEDLNDGNQQVGNALLRAERYLNLASLAAILLAAVAVALSANHFAQRRLDHAALLRCLGLSRSHTLFFFLFQLLFLGLSAGVLGALMGIAIQAGLFTALSQLLNTPLPALSAVPAITGMGTGLITLFGFALPPLLALGRVPPIRVLRQSAMPPAASQLFIYGLALFALMLLMWRLSLDWSLTLALLGGGLVAATVLGSLVWFSLAGLRRLLATRQLAWRLGFGQLLRKPLAAIGQVLAFGLILLSMALIALLRGELLDSWQTQLPSDAPNIFAINILPHEQQAFAEHIQRFDPRPATLFPMLPARLSQINQQPASEFVAAGSQGMQSLQRDLNVTWTEHLPSANAITSGQWWQASAQGAEISVEQEFAKRLGLSLGDRLTFTFGAVEKTATITSLRSVDWNSMQPNFFVIFSPESLNQLPFTWMTSFYLATDEQYDLAALNQQFPSVTLLQVDAIIEQLRSILAQVTLAVEFILLFVLAAGLTVLFAGLQSTLAERTQQAGLLRALGAERALLVKTRRYEFALIGFISGSLAWLGTELSSWVLYRYAFDLTWSPHPWLLLVPLLGAVVILTAGSLGTRKVLNTSPMQTLRQG